MGAVLNVVKRGTRNRNVGQRQRPAQCPESGVTIVKPSPMRRTNVAQTQTRINRRKREKIKKKNNQRRTMNTRLLSELVTVAVRISIVTY